MTTLHETIRVRRPANEAYAYIADFTTTLEWDSTVQAARCLTPGAIDVGTQFLVTCALPVGSIDLRYQITNLEPGHRIELRGEGRFFNVYDCITLTEDGEFTDIDYRARFEFIPLLNTLAKRFRPGLERMGEASVAGLKAALEDDFEAPCPAGPPELGDRLVLPRLKDFTRIGYKRGSKRWNPVSADLREKHIVITGASSGLGRAAALDLARRGALLTLVMRDPVRAERVQRDLIEETGNDKIEVEIADLSLLEQVDDLITRFLERNRPIDVLVNNAGALFNDYGETAEGIERSLALLLLSPWRLTLGLRPLLQAAGQPRVINVVSGGMYTQRLSVKTLTGAEPARYAGAVAYARAKRALMTVTREWACDWLEDGFTVNAMHPGWADTPGVETSLPRFHTLTRPLLRSPAEGADTIIWLAAATEAANISGELFLDRQTQPLHLTGEANEPAEEVAELMAYLGDYSPPAPASKPVARQSRG